MYQTEGSKATLKYWDVVELAKIFREDLKKKYPNIKFSITTSKYAGGQSIYIMAMDGNIDFSKNGGYAYVNQYHLDANEDLTEEGREVLKYVSDLVNEYRWDDSDLMSDYYSTNFYYDLKINPYYNNTIKESVKLIDENSFAKSYAELFRLMDGKRVKVTNNLRNIVYYGKFTSKSNTYTVMHEEKQREIHGDKNNKATKITSNGFIKLGRDGVEEIIYEIVE
jgi:hypothetical protein